MNLDQLGPYISSLERQLRMWRTIAIVLFVIGTIQWLLQFA